MTYSQEWIVFCEFHTGLRGNVLVFLIDDYSIKHVPDLWSIRATRWTSLLFFLNTQPTRLNCVLFDGLYRACRPTMKTKTVLISIPGIVVKDDTIPSGTYVTPSYPMVLRTPLKLLQLLDVVILTGRCDKNRDKQGQKGQSPPVAKLWISLAAVWRIFFSCFLS